MDLDGFFKSLKLIDFIFPNGHEEAFVTKAGWKERYIDFLVPENTDGDYMDCDLTDEENAALDVMIEEYHHVPNINLREL